MKTLQHVNLRVSFGRVGGPLWISPRFHRLHQANGIGHELHGSYSPGGVDFGVLLPWWDMLFRSAKFEACFDTTGVRDQVAQGRDHGGGIWSQQWLGLLRLVGCAGMVGFGACAQVCLHTMKLLLDSFWRALAYCLRPRVMVLSILPLLLMIGLSLGLGYVYWDSALEWVRSTLEASTLINGVSGWLQSVGLGGLKSALVPLIVIFAVTPIIVVMSLLTVALMMTPALTALVAEKRFPTLERKRGGSFLVSVLWSLLSTVLALVALLVSVPLWLIPPLILILPPLIWGWLTYRVMAFDALAEFASAEERRELFQRHRISLLCIGVFCGYLGAAPSLIWASGALLAAAFVILVPLAVWIYTLVFALSSLWFAHFCLAALQALRAERAPVSGDAETPEVVYSAPLPRTTDL